MTTEANNKILVNAQKLESTTLNSGNAVRRLYKRLCYPLFRWFLKPAIEAQNKVNSAMMVEIGKIMQEIASINTQMNRKLTPVKSVVYDHQFDYIGFENKYRGSEEAIREKQQSYLKYFQNQKNVIDIGCGRGEFLKLLKENQVEALGIDINDTMIRMCLENGLRVKKDSAMSFLRSSENNSLGGIIMNQVIEHIPFNQLVEIVALAYSKLKPGAYFIAETINPQSLIVFTEAYFLDPTHDRMIHPFTMQFLLEKTGFQESRIEYLSPVDTSGFLVREKGENNSQESMPEQSCEELSKLIYGYREYAAIGQK